MDLDRSRRTIDEEWCSELAPGGPYFIVSYPEGGVNLPAIETLVYLGSAQLSKDDGQSGLHFLFQNVESYHQHGDWSALSEDLGNDLAAEGAVMFFDEDVLGSIADIDGLLVLLNGLREHMRLGLGWDHVLPEDR